MSLSPEQIEIRRTGITATDIAAILGEHPYRSAVDVWREKRGDAPPFEGNERTRWGNILEPVIRDDYEQRRGVHVETRGTLAHPTDRWMLATPDGLVYASAGATEPDRGLEIKCHTIHLSHLYGAPGTDEIPLFELCQCMWGMAVTSLPRWDLVPFIDGQTADYTIDRDDGLIGMMRERAERFRVDHVFADVPPPPDRSEAYSAWLKAAHSADNAAAALIRIDDDPALLANVRRLRALRDEIATREHEETGIVQALKLAIGDRAGLEFPSGRTGKGKDRDRITWKKASDSTSTSYKAIVDDIQLSASLLITARADELRRACIALDKLSDVHFENSRATIRGADVRALLVQAFEHLERFAGEEPIARHRTIDPGSRRFIVPRWWKPDTANTSN